MKFGKILKNWASEESPENADLVLRFKDLKKQLKLIKPTEEPEEDSSDPYNEEKTSTELHVRIESGSQETNQALSQEERVFLQTLREDMEKFNDFFIDKEEDFIIRSRALEDGVEGETDRKKLRQIRSAFADLHGSMILLLHWSLLNFTAVIKILKKHDKRSGVLLRQPLLSSILKQPFNSTQRITNLIKKAEESAQLLFDKEESGFLKEAAEAHSNSQCFQDMKEQQAELSRRTKAALDVWEEMQANASTPSTVLPVLGKRKHQSEEDAATHCTDIALKAQKPTGDL